MSYVKREMIDNLYANMDLPTDGHVVNSAARLFLGTSSFVPVSTPNTVVGHRPS